MIAPATITKDARMNKNTVLLAALAACAAVSGCALDPSAQAEPRAERTYITGSNIARKQHSGEVSVMSAEAYEQARMGHMPGTPLTATSR
jgi:hypothetical protein